MVGVRAAEVVDELVTVGELGRIIAASAVAPACKASYHPAG